MTTLFGERWEIEKASVFVAVVTYFGSLVFLLISAYYSIKVRQVRSFHSLCADKILSVLRNGKYNLEKSIAELIADAKINESSLLIMTNYLSVAEKLFLRGLALLGVASVISVLSKLYAT